MTKKGNYFDKWPADPFEGVYKRGKAMGEADVRNDEMTFRFRNEVFTFPTMHCIHIARFNGYWYEAKISELRKLAKAKH